MDKMVEIKKIIFNITLYLSKTEPSWKILENYEKFRKMR